MKKEFVMKEVIRLFGSFISFEIPLQFELLNSRFLHAHNIYQKEFASWNFAGTRKRLIVDFWFKVLLHFSAIFVLALAATLPFIENSNLVLLPAVIASIFSFSIFTFFNYWPLYYTEFLPRLDSVIDENEKIILIESDIKKCKRTQFSIPTLTVIFYVFTKTSNMPLPPCNDRSAEILNNLFGADKDKIKQNLSRLYKLATLSPKERAEMQKGIDASRSFFEALQYSNANSILDQLEIKLHQV